jgi:hypothetical protein
MTKMLFVKSSDYWGYDAASFDDSVNFYRYSWVVPATQYSSMSDDDKERLFPCALFYVQGVTDNHNFLTLKIAESSSESTVAGMQGGKRRTRRYTIGSPAQYSVGTYALQEAPSGASTISDIQSAVESGSTSEGSFTVSEFLTDGTKIAEAVGMMTEDKAAESSAAFAAPASEPSGSAYLPVDPTVADPATEGYSESDLITMDDFSAEDFIPWSEEADSEDCYICGKDNSAYYVEEEDNICSSCDSNWEYDSDMGGYVKKKAEDFDAEGGRLRDIRGKFMNRRKAKNAVFGEVMSQQMSGYYRTGVVGDNPPVGQNIARRNPVAKARYFIEPGVQNPNSGEWSKGPNFQQARKIAKGVAWDTVQDMGLAAETAGLPVIPNSFGENSAPEDGHGVPQWYGSAETFEAMAWHDPKWADDRGNVERAFAREYPTKTIDKSSVRYLVYQSGASNKFHVFFMAEDSRGKWFAYNAYARIGYNPRLFEIGGPFSSKSQAESLISSKMSKKTRKGYTQAAETAGLPVIPNSFGENSAPIDGHGVPQWYGSAETYSAEAMPMTTLGDSEFPVLEDSYGGNTAWESGYGVPQWYGSAEEDEYLCKYCGQDPDAAFADDFWTDGVCIPCAKEHGESEDYDAQGISKTLEEAAPVSLRKPALMAALGLVAGIWMARR